MARGNHQDPSPTPLHRCGPRGLGEKAARALEQHSRSNQKGRGMEEPAFLRAWVEKEGCLIPTQTWESWILVSHRTLEHEVRFRSTDRRAVKKTWPGTFGFIPAWNGSLWTPKAATADRHGGGIPPPDASPKHDLPG